MPLYELKCEICGYETVELLSVDEESPTCPNCMWIPEESGVRIRLTKKISVCNSHFKGSGFYETDYKDKKK